MERDEAVRRYLDPAASAARDKTKADYWSANTSAPSAVFAQRLRETRNARGWTQAQLAERMTAKGHPISATAILRLESCQRGLSLDEAFALIEALDAVPVYMLTPPDDKLIRLSEGVATDGEGLRSWFVSGVDDLPPRLQQPPPAEIADAVEREQQERTNIARVARLAQAVVDAREDHERMQRAWDALLQEVLHQDHARADAD